jgi:hypothetical protein
MATFTLSLGATKPGPPRTWRGTKVAAAAAAEALAMKRRRVVSCWLMVSGGAPALVRRARERLSHAGGAEERPRLATMPGGGGEVAIVVQKYGGSSVADVERIGMVADRVAARRLAEISYEEMQDLAEALSHRRGEFRAPVAR